MELATTVDTVISIPNDRLIELVPRGTSVFEAFRIADDVLRQAVEGISNIITTPGLINRDFSDIRSIMVGMGHAMMGTATASGENAVVEAARQAIACPLLERGGVSGARGILINITGSSVLGLHEVNEACSLIREAAQNDEAQINFGVVMNESMGDKVKVTVIATGFEMPGLEGAVEPAAGIPEPEPEPVAPEQPAAALEPQPTPEPQPEPAAPEDDLDTPAFLRRERRLFR